MPPRPDTERDRETVRRLLSWLREVLDQVPKRDTSYWTVSTCTRNLEWETTSRTSRRTRSSSYQHME
eukprot:3247920-Heterocapsa_arctica.AAC.1